MVVQQLAVGSASQQQALIPDLVTFFAGFSYSPMGSPCLGSQASSHSPKMHVRLNGS